MIRDQTNPNLDSEQACAHISFIHLKITFSGMFTVVTNTHTLKKSKNNTTVPTEIHIKETPFSNIATV